MAKKAKKAAATKSEIDISLLLDRTGSMITNWSETISACNAYAKKMLDDETMTARVMVTVFDKSGATPDIVVIREWADRKSWKKIGEDETPPRGMTPLYEAVGLTIAKLRAEQRDKGRLVQLVIMTDGHENASSPEWKDVSRVRTTVDQINALQGWSVVFLGADMDAMQVAGVMNIPRGSTVAYGGQHVNSTMGAMASSSARFAATGQAQAAYFTDEERAKAKGGKGKEKA